ncbi:MAG: phosphotransferase [Gemmatales bacterium]
MNRLHIRWYGRWETLLERGLPRRWANLMARWMSRQRWYLGKGERASVVRLVQSWPLEIAGRTVWWCILEASSMGLKRQYQVPIVMLKEQGTGQIIAMLTGAESGFVVDAWTWPPFAEWVLRVMAGNEQVDHLAAWHEGTLRTNLQANPLLKEQSNTAVMLGETYFLKAIRALAPGIQPEEEMGRELTRRSFSHTIPLLGGLSLNTQHESTSLAVLSSFVPSKGSGWEWFLTSIRKNSEELCHTPLVLQRGVPPDYYRLPANSATLLESAYLLGQRTAELHRCLAQPSDNPAFAPEPFVQADYDALCARILQRYDNLWNLTKHHNGSPFRELFKHKDALLAITQQLFIPTTLQRHRIHGDYHLGQVLRTENDWLIIDFEGEPLRPLNERRAKDLGLRDVAGMIRSFGYLAGVSESSFPAELCKALIEGYGKVEPKLNEASSQQLLLLYVLEKTLYEIEYELGSRPEWVHIPLNGLVQLLKAASTLHPLTPSPSPSRGEGSKH